MSENAGNLTQLDWNILDNVYVKQMQLQPITDRVSKCENKIDSLKEQQNNSLKWRITTYSLFGAAILSIIGQIFVLLIRSIFKI